MDILTKRNRYIIPFRYGDRQNNCRDTIVAFDSKSDEFGGTWYQTSVRNGEQDIYEYILDSFDESGYSLESNIGAQYIYKMNGDNLLPSLIYHLDKLNTNENELSTGKDVDFDIVDVGLYLFNTGIGLLWYEISNIDLNEKDFEVFNFHFKELNMSKCFRLFTSSNYESFILGDWITRILKPLGAPISFYSNRENVCSKVDSAYLVPDKALLFNYIVFDSEDSNKEELTKHAYYLSKGYKSSYKVTENISENMYTPFSNACWAVSKEGAGYYLIAEDDNRLYYTGDKGLYKKVMNDYFLIYILVLQQSYTLLKFAETISTELSANPAKYLESELYLGAEEENRINNEFLKLERKVRELTTQVNVFLTKNVRASVSHIQHQNDFYGFVKDRLNVANDTKDLVLGLESLQGLLHDSKQQWEAQEEGKRDNKINIILGLFSVVAFISAVYDCESLIKDFFMSEEGTTTGSSLMWHVLPYGVVFIILIALWIVIFASLVKNVSSSGTSGKKSLASKINSLFHWKKEAELKKLIKENERIIEEANKDALTDCYNRKGLIFYSKKMLNEAKKKRKNLFVCSIDLNGLKYINDTFGHDAGDRAIKEIAFKLKDSVPESAKVFRTGGDEFQIIGVFERRTNAPTEILSAFDSKIAELNKNSKLDYSIGASYGWSMCIPEKNMTDIDDMFKEADSKMYEMKIKTDEHRRD